MRVFLSYRRDYARWVARAMCQALEHRGIEVFLDVDAIDSGRFENVVLNQIGKCEHFVVLLTTGTAHDLGRAGDWVTKELNRALELEKNVIPILVDDASIEDVSETFSRRGELLALNFLHLPHDLFAPTVAVLVERFLTQPSLQELHSRTAAEHCEAGTRALHQTNWAAAEAEFEKALVLRTRPEYFFGRGRAKECIGRYQEALNDYEAAISLDPFAYELILAKFDVLQQLDRLGEAINLRKYWRQNAAMRAREFGRRITQELDGSNDIASAVRTIPELCNLFDELPDHEQISAALACLLEHTSVHIGDLHARLQAELHAWRDTDSSNVVADP